jgi:hypothetical protein
MDHVNLMLCKSFCTPLRLPPIIGRMCGGMLGRMLKFELFYNPACERPSLICFPE